MTKETHLVSTLVDYPSGIVTSQRECSTLVHVRICRETSCRNDAIISAKSLTARMLRQGADKYTLKAFLTRSLNKHQIPVDKFDTPTESFIKECI